MPRFSANLTFMFGEHDFPDRFSAAAKAGFKMVEFAFPYDHPAGELKDRLRANDLTQVLINLPPGDFAAGELGMANDPDRRDEFRQGVALAVEYARTLGASMINCLAGRRLEDVPEQDQRRVLVENMQYAADELDKYGLTALVEPINTFDVGGYFIATSREALEIMDAAARPNLGLQYDVYHMQKMEGNLADTIRANLARIGHIQIADNPGRLQPGTGEINFRYLLNELDRMGYSGLVGLEYFALPPTLDTLAWMEEWGLSRS